MMNTDLHEICYTNMNIFKKQAEQKARQERPSQCGGIQQHGGWNPYDNNEGTVIAIAGKTFVTVCTDTRISSGYSIISRNYSKTTKLTESVVLTSGGMVADIEALHKLLLTKIKIYKMQNKREPSLDSLAKLLSNTLYGRRMMPYYAFNLLCGLDPANGEGVIFGYDAVGSFDRITYGAQGSG